MTGYPQPVPPSPTLPASPPGGAAAPAVQPVWQLVLMIVLGVVELLGSAVVGALLLLASVGAAMCSDAGTAQYCHRIDTGFVQTLALTGATVVLAIATLVACRCRHWWARLVGLAGVLFLVAMIVRAVAFYHLASQPLG